MGLLLLHRSSRLGAVVVAWWCVSGWALDENLNIAFDLSYLVYLEFFRCWALDHNSSRDVELGAMALA
jgi:hypothetical protein